MSNLKNWIYSFWKSKIHECAWCGQKFNIDYELPQSYTPLCSDSCALCYFSKHVEVIEKEKEKEKEEAEGGGREKGKGKRLI